MLVYAVVYLYVSHITSAPDSQHYVNIVKELEVLQTQNYRPSEFAQGSSSARRPLLSARLWRVQHNTTIWQIFLGLYSTTPPLGYSTSIGFLKG